MSKHPQPSKDSPGKPSKPAKRSTPEGRLPERAPSEQPGRSLRVSDAVRYDASLLTEYDVFLFKQGTHYTLYEKLGAHRLVKDGTEGVFFAVWAPNARGVSVVGDFNGWNPDSHALNIRWDGSGIWEGFIPGLKKWDLYKFHIRNSLGGQKDKMDPFAAFFEVAPRTASVLHWPEYEWNDGGWMAERKSRTSLSAPWSVYEVHLGSWKHHWHDGLSLSYRELAEELPRYCAEMGFTAVELLPVMEHPFYASWGYQTLGYFAPSSRYGTPEDFMFLVDRLHQAGIAVILDWVPSHFPTDDFGLARYDGTALYEHEDPRKGFHPDWGSYIFNYSRNEVRSYLISSAVYWLGRYHADGLRIDAVASMLYLDYSRGDGEWQPNVYGGRENLEAIAFLRDLNKEVYGRFPDIQTIAEESTDWPMVTRPVFLGGLGFGMKWNMGWMHDTLAYASHDPVHRSYHHDQLTFSLWYAFSENFMLPLSHDEVVHGKGSLMNKMPGDWWQRRANLRLLLGYMWTHPGKKLLFMGGEFGQGLEWNHNTALEWHLLDNPDFQGIQRWVRDLNAALRRFPPLYEKDFSQDGFRWVDCADWRQSVIAYLRKGAAEGEYILAVANFTPVPRGHYRIGVPQGGFWTEVLNSDARDYGGGGMGNAGGMEADPFPCHGYGWSLPLTLPPLSVVVFYSDLK
ncbi:MAG: 1,4-alpha-glucan branching protein GlgB [Synergistaceae bacterium]|jgi:1,4-alpha-glucan branching enzyme|nr:1,4-alpha-glucan branching protein GlgB [Synergistaceae bacterium]